MNWADGEKPRRKMNTREKNNQLTTKYKNLHVKLAKEKNRRCFLVRCKNLGITPTFIKIKDKSHLVNSEKFKRKYSSILTNFYFQLLNLCIADSCVSIRNLNVDINNLKNDIETCFDKSFTNPFFDTVSQKSEVVFNKIKNKNIKKLDNLANKSKTQATTVNNKWIENLTQVHIPELVRYFLSLGPKFSLSNTYLPVFDMIASVETGIYHLSNDTKDIIRGKICNILTNTNKKMKHIRKNAASQYNFYFNKTKSFLKEHPEILVLQGDKCNKTVIMSRTEYELKMNSLLGDTSTYKQEKRDLTSKTQDAVNKLILKWHKSGTIDTTSKNKLTCYNGQAPYIYGLPKLHKAGIPLRPIVSNVGSPTYNLSKFLSTAITKILGKNDYYVRDSWHFHEFIKNKNVPNDFMLVSFDVTSLFTNIPTDFALECIKKRWAEISVNSPLNLNEFTEGVKLCLDSTFFRYNETFYSQIFGTAMGSPISSTIANLVMEELENVVISSLDYIPAFYKRYVDDCILCIPKNKLEYTQQAFNSFHPKIQFTVEKEDQQSINFLDIKLSYKNNGIIETDWFTKKVWSQRYLNYESNTPISYKKSVVISLTDRAVKLAHGSNRPKNIQIVKDVLKANNYPPTFFEPIIKKRIHQIYNSQNNHIKKEREKCVSLPYIRGTSENIQKVLSKHNICVAHKPNNDSKRCFSKLKPKRMEREEANVVYKINCEQCSGTYIGQTSQYLHKRTSNHVNSIKNNLSQASALARHALDLEHNFNFQNAQVIAKENNFHKRAVLEMLHIKKNKDAINNKNDIQNLSHIYNNLIQMA